MSLKPLHLISVGRPRAVYWREAATHYLDRLKHWRKLTETVIRDADSALPLVQKKRHEGERILASLTPQDILICLDEHGKSMTSPQFSQFLDSLSSDLSRRPCFVVGGPFGLDPKVIEKARHTIALGPQTLPHELARVVLLEQLYRAECILRKTPYHHE